MRNDDANAKFTCGCWLFLMALNLIAGAWSVNLLLNTFLHKTIPFLGAMVIGLIGGEVTIPLAIVIWVLKFFHVM